MQGERHDKGQTPSGDGTGPSNARHSLARGILLSVVAAGLFVRSLATSRRVRGLAIRLGVLGLIVVLLHVSGCMDSMYVHPLREPTPLPRTMEGEHIRFLNEDGHSLSGWYLPAAGAGADQQRPTIVHVHGNAGNILYHVEMSQHFTTRGFNVLIFDYRGFGESEGRARSREALVRDTHAAIDAALARPETDPDRLGMYGQSLGAAVGLWVMHERPEISAAVFESPFSSWRRMGANAVGGDPPFFLASWLAALLVRDTHAPIHIIDRIDRPILLVHGTSDRIVPASHTHRLADVGGPNVESLLIDGGDHNTLQLDFPVARSAMQDFLAKHLDLDDDD